MQDPSKYSHIEPAFKHEPERSRCGLETVRAHMHRLAEEEGRGTSR